MSSDLAAKTARGVKWSAISMSVNQAVTFAATVAMARLLSPTEFGLFGMATVFSGFAVAINDLGLGAAIVQRKELDTGHLSTAYWSGLAAGLLIAGLFMLCAPLLSAFYNDKSVGTLAKIFSLCFVIAPLSAVHNSLMTREFNYRGLAAMEIGGALAGSAAAIAMAAMGFGVWSLALRDLISECVKTVIATRLQKFRPCLHFSWSRLKELTSFGGYVMGGRVLNYGAGNVDYLIIGKTLGAAALGIYTVAYRIMVFPLRKISMTITRVLFPAFSSIQSDNERLRKGYVKTLTIVSIISFPVMTFLFVTAPEFIVIIFGTQWVDAAMPLRLLCITGYLKAIGTTVGPVLCSKGRADIDLRLNLLAFAGLTAAVLAGGRFGINGVAAGVTIFTCIYFPLIQGITNRLIALSARQYIFAVMPAALISMAMLAALLPLRGMLQRILGLNSPVAFALAAIAGLGVAAGALRFGYANIYNEILRILAQAARLPKPHRVGKEPAHASPQRSATR